MDSIKSDRSPRARSGPDIAVTRLVDLLAQSLGLEKAETVVQTGLTKRGLFGQKKVSTADCRALLDQAAEEKGIVAIAARLAKIKLIVEAAAERQS